MVTLLKNIIIKNHWLPYLEQFMGLFLLQNLLLLNHNQLKFGEGNPGFSKNYAPVGPSDSTLDRVFAVHEVNPSLIPSIHMSPSLPGITVEHRARNNS